MAFMPSVESPEIESVGGVTESVGMIYVDLVVVKGAIDRNVTVLLMANPQDGDTAFEGEHIVLTCREHVQQYHILHCLSGDND